MSCSLVDDLQSSYSVHSFPFSTACSMPLSRKRVKVRETTDLSTVSSLSQISFIDNGCLLFNNVRSMLIRFAIAFIWCCCKISSSTIVFLFLQKYHFLIATRLQEQNRIFAVVKIERYESTS